MKVLVTGDNGYIGTVMVDELKKKGHEVIGLDTGYFKGCELYEIEDIPRIQKDIRDVSNEDIENKNIEAIIHLAALSNDPLGELKPEITEKINYEASVHLAEIAVDCGIKRFVFSSSCSIFGIVDGVANETTEPKPLTEYAKSKIETEKALIRMVSDAFCPIILRNSTVYGLSPKMRFDLVLNNFVGRAITTGKIKIFSDGTPWRPLIHIRDLSRVFAEMLVAPEERVRGQVINVGQNKQNYQVRDIADCVRKILDAETTYTGEHPDSRSYKVSFEKLKNIIPDFEFEWDIEKGTKEMASFLKKINFRESDFLNEKFLRISHLQGLIASGKIDGDMKWKA